MKLRLRLKKPCFELIIFFVLGVQQNLPRYATCTGIVIQYIRYSSTTTELGELKNKSLRTVWFFLLVRCQKQTPRSGDSGILAFILVFLLQGWYVLKIPS